MEFVINSSYYKLELRNEGGDHAMLFEAIYRRKFCDFTIDVRGFKVEFVCRENHRAGVILCGGDGVTGDMPRIRIHIASELFDFVDKTGQNYIDACSPYPGLTVEKLYGIVREAMRYVELYLEPED